MPPSASSSPSRCRRSRRRAGLLAAVVVVALAPLWIAPSVSADEPMTPGEPQPVQADPDLKEVLTGILCRCGCNLSVYDCESTMTCEVAGKMRADAEKLLKSGMSPEQVLGRFKTDYGEQVLAAPTKEGFNLMAWILPFAALGGGLIAVTLAVRAWRPRRLAAEPEDESGPGPDPRYVAAVEDEVEREV